MRAFFGNIIRALFNMIDAVIRFIIKAVTAPFAAIHFLTEKYVITVLLFIAAFLVFGEHILQILFQYSDTNAFLASVFHKEIGFFTTLLVMGLRIVLCAGGVYICPVLAHYILLFITKVPYEIFTGDFDPDLDVEISFDNIFGPMHERRKYTAFNGFDPEGGTSKNERKRPNDRIAESIDDILEEEKNFSDITF